MSDPQLLLLASNLRVRAEEILAKAETMDDAEARQMMRAAAAGYGKLAQRVQHRADEA